MSTLNTVEDSHIVERAVGLSLIEVFLGTFLHTFKIPFAGHFLSLNQGLYLTRMTEDHQSRMNVAKNCLEVSVVAAMMKTLAPSVKKLGPMISITTQGFLYSLGQLFFGTKLIGQLVSMILLSLWAFVQPLITYYIMYGSDLERALIYFAEKIQSGLSIPEEFFWGFFIALILVKLSFAMTVPFIVKRLEGSILDRFENFLKSFSRVKKETVFHHPLRGAMLDLLRPSVIFSIVMMGVFFSFNGLDSALIVWKLSRAISIAFLLFFLARTPMVSKIFFKLARKHPHFDRLYQISALAYRELRTRL